MVGTIYAISFNPFKITVVGSIVPILQSKFKHLAPNHSPLTWWGQHLNPSVSDSKTHILRIKVLLTGILIIYSLGYYVSVIVEVLLFSHNQARFLNVPLITLLFEIWVLLILTCSSDSCFPSPQSLLWLPQACRHANHNLPLRFVWTPGCLAKPSTLSVLISGSVFWASHCQSLPRHLICLRIMGGAVVACDYTTSWTCCDIF